MIAIIQYNAGNATSVKNALDRLGYPNRITADPALIQSADKVIFPGVGEASTAMKYLRNRNLDQVLSTLRQPVLGICLGLQLMCRHSEEGDTDCLGIFDVDVKNFPATGIVPHMGWNSLIAPQGTLFNGIDTGEDFYFVHSYYAEKSESTIAEAHYLLPFSAALQRDNFYAVQFHPEKSAETGKKLLMNFLKI